MALHDARRVLTNQVATDLHSGAHRAVSIRLLWDQLVDSKSEHSLAELAVESQRQSGNLSMPQLLNLPGLVDVTPSRYSRRSGTSARSNDMLEESERDRPTQRV